MSELRLVPYGPASISQLRDAVVRAKDGDPLAPVTIAVPSNYAGLSLRRTFAGESSSGLLNVRFYVLARVAELIGAPILAAQGKKPLTGIVRAEAVRSLLAADSGELFGDVKEHTATERSLDATFRDLRYALDEQLDALERRGDRAAHIVRLYRSFRERTAAYYDELDLAEAAAGAVRSGAAALRDLGHVVLFLPRRLSPTDHLMLSALAGAGLLSAIIGLTGDQDADGEQRALANVLSEQLRQREEILPEHPPTGTSVVAASDAEEEVRTVLRIISARLAGGLPLHRIAVLYSMAQPYALLGTEQFRAAGIPHNGPAVKSLAQTLPGRTLLGLLRLRELQFRRDAVMDWLSSAPVLAEPGGRPAPAHRWDELSRAASVVSGKDQWHQRLERYAAGLRARYAATEDNGEARAGQLERIAADIERTERLARFIDELAAQVGTTSLRSWADFGAWGRVLLDRYLGGEGHRASWPDEELQAHRAIEDVLEALAGLDEGRTDINESTFRRALERELERPAARVGRFGDGVFIGRLADAAGASFDLVFVVGMSEGAIPGRSRDDPLLPDRERAAAGGEMPLRSRRAVDQRRDYLAALATAPERILMFPRADLRGQRGKLPAPWLLETASELEGARLFNADLEALNRDWLTAIPSFEGALAGPLPPASQQEYDLTSLRAWAGTRPVVEHYLAAHSASLRDGLLSATERQRQQLGRWDGYTGPLATGTTRRMFSPTALQDWAVCPFRFFLGRILYVEEVSLPEETLTLSPIDRGNLLHKALEMFIREAPRRTSPDEVWTDAERARLLEIGRTLCQEAEAAGITGKRVLWQLASSQIMRDLQGFLDKDEELRRDFGVVNEEVELSFGFEGDDALVVSLDDGSSLTFRGRIDRVDRSPDGSRLLVIDYKSGSLWGYKDLETDAVQRGTSLQLPVYALAAMQRYGEQETEAYYWFVTERGKYERRGRKIDGRALARFREVLGVIDGGIRNGIFPARPGERKDQAWENCTFCAYHRVCPSDRTRVWERKRQDDRLAQYVRLAES